MIISRDFILGVLHVLAALTLLVIIVATHTGMVYVVGGFGMIVHSALAYANFKAHARRFTRTATTTFYSAGNLE